MKREIEVSAALIFENGKMFATKRGDSPFAYVAHKYEFPGGKIEKGETPENALIREMKEELEMAVEVERLFAVSRYEYPDFIITLHLFECRRKSNFILKEHEDAVWLSPSQIDEDAFAPADGEVLRSIKRVFGS